MISGAAILHRVPRRLAESVALSLDRDEVGVVYDALDEGGRADRGGEDRVPVLEGEVRGEDEALLLVSLTTWKSRSALRLSKARNPTSSRIKRPTLA